MSTEVPEGWTKIDLNREVEFLPGYPFDSESFNQEQGYPLIRIRDLLNHKTETLFEGKVPDKYVVQKGDVLVGMDGDFNIVRWKGNQGLLNQRILRIRSKNENALDTTFFYYYIDPFLKKINARTGQTTVKHLSIYDFYPLDLYRPKIEVQRRIAAILQSVDTAIDKTMELIEKFKKMKQGLMQDLFMKGLNENGKMHLHLKDSELGLIPEEWSVWKIGELYTNLSAGSTPSRNHPEYFKGEILWVTSGELKYRVITDTIEKITEKAVRDTNLRVYQAGTFFIAITGLEAEGTLGSCAIIGKPATVNQSCMAFEKNRKMDTGFLFQYYRYYGKNLIFRYAQGTKQQSIPRKVVEGIPIKVPPTIEEQKRIADVLFKVDAKIYSEEEYLNKLTRIKEGLMQDLLTGRVQVAA